MRVNDNHYLEGDNVTYVKCTKNSKKFLKGFMDTIVMHYTQGSSAKSSAYYMANPNIQASAHIVIGREGEIIQLVPFDTISWHAGKSEHNGRKYMNYYSIGVEMDNAGILNNNGVSVFKKKYNHYDIYKDDNGKLWHKYTEKQLSVLEAVTKLLINKYGIKHIVGHSDISPGRKLDPGKAFPMERYKSLLNKNK